jgi:methyl-accepting chemotaxis protein
MKGLSLKIKFTLIMVALSLFCASTVGLVILFKAQDSISDLSMQYAKSASEASASNIIKYFEPYWFSVETVGHIMERYKDLSPDERRHFFNSALEALVKENQGILAAWCNWEPNILEGNDSQYIGVPGTLPSGRFTPYWFKTPAGVKVETLVDYENPEDDVYYMLVKNSERTTIFDPYPYMVDGKEILVTSIAAPIHSEKGAVLGIIGIDIRVDDIQKITQANKPYDDALTTVFSHDGTIAAHFDPSHVGKKLLESENNMDMLGTHLEDYLRALKKGEPYSFVRYIPTIGSDMTFFFSPIRVDKSDTPWSFAVAVSTKTVMAPVYDMIRISVIISMMILIAVIIVAVYMSNSVSKPIIKVTNTIKDISEGEGDLTQSIKVQSKDEIGDLARYFNKLMEALRKPISETKTVVEHLASSSKDLSSVSRELSASSEETVSTATNVASTTEEMSVNINAMAGGAEEASVNANEVAGAAEQMSMNMNMIAAAIEEMSASISQIANNADEARKVAGDATAKSKEATSTMNKLGAAAKEIGQVTDVIKKIADKTNLLALNATIEAASAGEAGKGFAVVAGEIKELANQSAASADDIARRIDGIQSETNNAVTVIRDVSDIIARINQSVESIAGHVGQQTKASNEIASNVAQANTGAKRVANSIAEVAKGSHDIARNAGEAATGAINVSHNVSGMREVARKSSEGASQVNSSAESLSKMAGQLRTVMSKFKV